MDQRFTFNFPVYAFLLADGSGTLYFRAGEELFLPLFTDWKVVESYLKGSAIDGVSVIKLANATALRDFLENPPTGAVKCSALGDPLLGPLAKNVIRMWYIGNWAQLPP